MDFFLFVFFSWSGLMLSVRVFVSVLSFEGNLRTCQVYSLSMITEPGGKDLSILMSCSDHFSFQSKINYCFITRLSPFILFTYMRKLCIIHKLKIKLRKVTISSDQISHHVTFPHSALVGHIPSYLAWKVFCLFFQSPAFVICRN